MADMKHASDVEPEEEDDDEVDESDGALASDSSPHKAGRKRSNSNSTYLMPHIHASSVWSDSETGGDSIVSASAYWRDGVPPESIDVRLAATRRYFRAARALYELQFQMKRPAAILRMKTNAFGFKMNSTFDTLAALLSPLRQRQVFDDWTPLELAIFEESFERFGRRFHLIADQLPRKSSHDVIALFYVWKRHGSCASTYHNYDDDVPDLELPTETKYYVDQLRRRQACTKAFINAARALFTPRSAPTTNHKRAKIADFGLCGAPMRKSAIHATSTLRSPSVLDTWTPLELRVFEVAIECYGKDFYRVAHVIGSKTCRDVIALYYVWKKDAQYQTVKNRWGKTDDGVKKTDFVAPAHAHASNSSHKSDK